MAVQSGTGLASEGPAGFVAPEKVGAERGGVERTSPFLAAAAAIASANEAKTVAACLVDGAGCGCP